jgi:hypothetical protein
MSSEQFEPSASAQAAEAAAVAARDKESALLAFLHAAAYSALQAPADSVAQIVDGVLNTNIHRFRRT